jgi:hypothetical protein
MMSLEMFLDGTNEIANREIYEIARSVQLPATETVYNLVLASRYNPALEYVVALRNGEMVRAESRKRSAISEMSSGSPVDPELIDVIEGQISQMTSNNKAFQLMAQKDEFTIYSFTIPRTEYSDVLAAVVFGIITDSYRKFHSPSEKIRYLSDDKSHSINIPISKDIARIIDERFSSIGLRPQMVDGKERGLSVKSFNHERDLSEESIEYFSYGIGELRALRRFVGDQITRYMLGELQSEPYNPEMIGILLQYTGNIRADKNNTRKSFVDALTEIVNRDSELARWIQSNTHTDLDFFAMEAYPTLWTPHFSDQVRTEIGILPGVKINSADNLKALRKITSYLKDNPDHRAYFERMGTNDLDKIAKMIKIKDRDIAMDVIPHLLGNELYWKVNESERGYLQRDYLREFVELSKISRQLEPGELEHLAHSLDGPIALFVLAPAVNHDGSEEDRLAVLRRCIGEWDAIRQRYGYDNSRIRREMGRYLGSGPAGRSVMKVPTKRLKEKSGWKNSS